MSAVSAALAVVPGLVRAVTPTPTPSPTGTVATSLGSPGITGFVVTFVLAIALIGLFLSLTRHLRIVDRRSRQLEEQDASAAEAGTEADPEPGAEPGVVPPAPDAEPGGR
ncbi:MAG TPA: hypothetical protein VFW79_04580 [Cellulomonas sp.]|uniref:hypothetical protein n=1 Tax=Cellulomonas sp. TaxID=40001 RepID=UPI002E30C908|nr:hypothetical protein [Cellulomonas sp.]HEX5331899.1 hypothetical protein [Cellulomonas sp.]